MTVNIGPNEANQDYTADEGLGAGIHTPRISPKWYLNEKTVVAFEAGNTTGTLDVSARFQGGTTFFSMGTIAADGGVPVEIEVPGIAEIRLAANGLTANYAYQIMGADL